MIKKLAFLLLVAGCLMPTAPAVDSVYGWRSQLYLEPDTVVLKPGDSVAIEAYYIKPNGDSVEVNDSTLFFILHEGGEMHGWPIHYYVAGDTACTGWGGCRVWAEDRSRNKDYPPSGETIVVIESTP